MDRWEGDGRAGVFDLWEGVDRRTRHMNRMASREEGSGGRVISTGWTQERGKLPPHLIPTPPADFHVRGSTSQSHCALSVPAPACCTHLSISLRISPCAMLLRRE